MIWDEPLDKVVDYSLPHEKYSMMIVSFPFQHNKFNISSSPNTYLSNILEQEEGIIHTFINLTFPLFKTPSQVENLMETHHSYSKDPLEQADNGILLNIFPYSYESMEKKYLDQGNASQPILSVKVYPLLTIKDCPPITVKGKSSDPLDSQEVSHTYLKRNNPQFTTSLPPSQ